MDATWRSMATRTCAASWGVRWFFLVCLLLALAEFGDANQSFVVKVEPGRLQQVVPDHIDSDAGDDCSQQTVLILFRMATLVNLRVVIVIVYSAPAVQSLLVDVLRCLIVLCLCRWKLPTGSAGILFSKLLRNTAF